MTTLASLLHPAYLPPFAPGNDLAHGAQLVDGQWWHPVFGCNSLQYVVDNARQALTPKIVMNQSAWLNVAICAARRSMIAVQEANRSKPESSERRLHNNREIDEWSTVNMAFNRAARTKVLLDSCAFRWMFDYSGLDQTVMEEAP